MDRRELSLRMREVLDHLSRGCDQWQFQDGSGESLALQSMERDLAELQRLCRAAGFTVGGALASARAA